MATKRFVLTSACFVVAACLAVAADNYAKKIIGKWDTRTQEQPVGATMEFFKNGKMRIRFGSGAGTVSYSGTYKIEDDKLSMTLNMGGQNKTDTSTIKKLSDRELHLQDASGNMNVYKRMK